jgi:integrase/recombinase XerD
VLAIPAKRFDRRIVTFLTPTEVKALLASPDHTTWAGRRDHALLLTAAQTGLRISELIGLACGDVQLGTGPHLRAFGKGRKERVAPLTSQTVAVLRVWMRERQGQPAEPLFPSRDDGPLTRDAIERRLAKHVAAAQRNCQTLRTKRVTMHVFRHTAAMMLLTAGIDTTTIALWLGHEQQRTTRFYLHADLGLKQRVLDQTTPRTVALDATEPATPSLSFSTASDPRDYDDLLDHGSPTRRPSGPDDRTLGLRSSAGGRSYRTGSTPAAAPLAPSAPQAIAGCSPHARLSGRWSQVTPATGSP